MRLFGLFLLLSVSPAWAQTTAVQKYIRTAITLYENLEYEKALKQLKSARLKASGPDDEAKIALLEGIVLADMGKEEKALSAFKAAFSVNLEAKLPVDVSPKVEAVAEKARSNVRKLLAPQLEAQAQEDAQRVAEEQRAKEARQQEEAVAAAAAVKRQEAGLVPPPAPPSVKETPVTGPSARSLSWIPGVVGLAAGGVSAALLVSANNRYNALTQGTVSIEEAASYRDRGKMEATLGYTFAGVAAAGLASAALMFALGAPPDSTPTVSAIPVQGGGLLSVHFSL